MTTYEVYGYILNASVYLCSLVFSFFAMYSFDIKKLTRNVHPIFQRMFHFAIVIGLAFLIGSFFMQFLPKFTSLEQINSLI